MTCRVCGHATAPLFAMTVLSRHRVGYGQCPRCGVLQTDEPTWLDEAYAQPIAEADTGLLARNIRFARLTATLLYFAFEHQGRFLDYAAGYGVFTRLMRDIGFDYYWHDPHARNQFAAGFAYRPGMEPFELLSAFEAFEHFVHPREELERMLRLSRSVLFSTLLLPDPVPPPGTWWYYLPETGQHVSFYAHRTLAYLAERHGLRLYTNGSDLHLLTERTLPRPLFRHLHRLAKYGGLDWVRRRMRSRTAADMEVVLQRSRTGVTPP